jgi:ABC-type glycerol-3-phosphate transport system permease component
MLKRNKNENVLKSHKMNRFSWVILVFMIIYAILLLIPYVFAFITSFKSLGDFRDYMFSWTVPTLENYKKVMQEFVYPVVLKDGSSGYYDFWGMVLNSFLVSVGGAFMMTMTPCVCAYCASKFDFAIGKLLTTIVYVTMSIPIIGSTAASIQMTQFLGLHDTIVGTWFLKATFLGLNYLLYLGNFKSIPKDYTEAAYMDGAGNFRIFFRIIFPMVRNLFNLQMILGFVQIWSDYSVPMYYLPSTPTLSLAMLNFSSLSSTSVTMQMAGCMLLSLPNLVLFVLFKEKFMGNIQMGGVKG